jgi:hypothetical protein
MTDWSSREYQERCLAAALMQTHYIWSASWQE